MTILEMSDIINSAAKEKKCSAVTDEALSTFAEIISISPAIKSTADQVIDAKVFYAMYPSVREAVGISESVDVFYAYKMGYAYVGIPNKLCFILKHMKSIEPEAYNLGLQRAQNLIKKYIGDVYCYEDSRISFKDVLDNIYGQSVKLLSDGVRKVQHKGFWEVYIPDIDRVALMPDDIGSALSFEDCCALKWDKNVGITLNGEGIRFMRGRIGITTNDFDLRECV